MPANVETAVFSNTPAWHKEGVVLDSKGDQGLTVEEAIPASGLDWEVQKVPVFAFQPSSGIKSLEDFANAIKEGRDLDIADLIPAADRYGVQRQTDGKLMGTVGRTWQPVQNLDGFSLIDDVIQEAGGSTWIEAAGALDGGKKVWILAHVAEELTIAGERYEQYILFTNGHDGRSSVTAAMTNVRVVCANTLAWALEEATRVVRVRHTTKATERIKEAKAILGLRSQYAEELAKQGEWLVEQSMTDAQFEQFLEQLMPVEHEEGTPAHTMVTERRQDVAAIYTGAANLAPIRGTRWGALQAAVEYADYGRSFQNTETQLKNQWGIVGSGTVLKDRAFSIVKNPKLVAA